MENGTIYIVRPRMQSSNSGNSLRFISPGSSQLLVGPASSLRALQIKVRSSTPGHVRRIGKREIAAGTFYRIESAESAARDQGTGRLRRLRLFAVLQLL